MPVKRRNIGPADPSDHRGLVDELAGELASPHPFGQPMIDEDVFTRTGLLGVTVIWDRWQGIADNQRTGIILAAYETSRGIEEKNRIPFAVGNTVDEAIEAGRLPILLVPHLRKSDRMTLAQLRAAMKQVGGAYKEDGDFPAVLYFPSQEDAEAGIQKLIEVLPESTEIWGIASESARPSWAN